MNDKLRENLLGEYFSNFFIIKLSTDIDFLDLGKNDNHQDLGTFIHEYLHFVQNISTTYGNINLITIFSKLLGYMNIIATNEDSKINRIIKLSNEIEFSYNMCNITLGDMEEWTYNCYDNIRLIGHKVLRDDVFGPEYEQSIVPTLELELCDKGKKPVFKELNFGAMAIMESMASLFERHIYPMKYISMQVQYDICTILWNHFVPKLKNRYELIFAACDASLMYENPGMIFYSILRFYGEVEGVLEDIDAVYQLFEEKIQPNYKNSYKKNYDELVKLLNNLIPPNHEFYKPLNTYINEFLLKVNRIRENKTQYFADMMLKNSMDAKFSIIEFMKQTNAVPVIITKDNQLWGGMEDVDNSTTMLNFLALYAFDRLLGINGRNQCYLKDICEKELRKFYNHECIYCPWEKAKYNELCPMGQIWHSKGMSGKSII